MKDLYNPNPFHYSSVYPSITRTMELNYCSRSDLYRLFYPSIGVLVFSKQKFHNGTSIATVKVNYLSVLLPVGLSLLHIIENQFRNKGCALFSSQRQHISVPGVPILCFNT